MCECITERQMLEVYRQQVKYDPKKMYSHRFLPDVNMLRNQAPESVVYDQMPHEQTLNAVKIHNELCCPVSNFDLQFRKDNLAGLQYISSKVPIPSQGDGFLTYPRVHGNPVLDPPGMKEYDLNNYPPAKLNNYMIRGVKRG